MLSTSHPLITAGQLGAMLQAARKAEGLTHSALASRIGLSQSRGSHLELHAWCAALGLELAVRTRDSTVVSTVSAKD